MTEHNIKISDVELFLTKNLKELPQGHGKYKVNAECSLNEFLSKFEEYCKQL